MAFRNIPVVVRPLAAAAVAVSMPLALALSAGQALGQQSTAPTTGAGSALDRARQLLDAGRPVAAKAALLKSFQDDPTIRVGDQNQLTPSESRLKAVELLNEANRKIKLLDPMDQSIQKAEVALADGDLRTAERHAKAVQRSATSSRDQTERAASLVASIDRRRHELETTVPDALAQAERDFMAGRYAQAKAGLEMVWGSGAALTADQQAMLDRYQLKLVDMAGEHPGLFGDAASAGVMQPGTVRRREEQPATQPPTQPPPAEQPAAQPPAIEPLPPPPAQPQPPVEDPTRLAMRTEAASLVAQADRAYDEKQFNTALTTYTRVRNEFRDYLTPEQVQHVSDRISQSQAMLNRAAPPAPDQPNVDFIIKQQTVAQFDNNLDRADRELKSGNPTRARDYLAQAEFVLNTNRRVFPESEFETMTQRLSAKRAEIATAEQQLLEVTKAQQAAALAESQTDAERLQRQERERRIIELIDRIRAYQSEQRYEEALQATDQLLFLDRNNPTGLLLHDTIYDIIIYTRAWGVYNLKQEGYAKNSLDNQEASIPPANLINYPLDWPAISVRRGGDVMALADTPENRRVLAELNNPQKKIPSVNFSDNSLQDVVAFLQSVSNQNIDVDWASLEQANIQKDTTVSLSLTNITPKTLLDRLVQKVSGTDRSSRADWAVNDGVITIASEDKIRANTTLVIYDVRDLLHEVPDYTDVPRIDLQQALQSSGGGGGGGGGGQSPFREEGNDRQQQQRDRDQRMDDLISIVTQNVDFEGWQENGGDTGKVQKMMAGGGGNLIITNTAKNHRAIAGLLAKLREIRAMQINVETRFLLVNQDFFEQIGFDLDIYLNANNNQIRTARAADRSIQARDFFQAGGAARVVTGQQAPNAATTTPAGTQLTQAWVNPRSWSPIGIQQDSLGLSTAISPRTDWSDAILGAAPALGIAGQFLDDIQVDFLVTATQADRRAIQLTAPRLTFTNGQTSSIYVATQTAFVSDLTPVVGDSAVGFDPTVAVVTEGVTMLVEGTVTSDRRYVTMNVDAGVARVDGFAQQSVSAVAGGQLVSSAQVQSFIQLPKVTVTRVRTTVTVPDQGTILMGGQRLVTEFEVETGVPVLSKLPIINRFFTNRIESKEEQTLLILIKPTILIQNEEEEKNYPGLLDQMRLGSGG